MKTARAAVLVVFAGVITLALQSWVGELTIYDTQVEARRLELHRHILENRPPEGRTWGEIGANGTNIRVVPVYAAEGLHRLLGISVGDAYRLLDTGFLFAGLIVLAAFLSPAFPGPYVAAGVLFVAAMLPLTYFLHYFHPWDRISFLLWILMAWLIRARRPLLLAVVVGLSVAVKYDAVVVPGLFWLVWVTRTNWRLVTAQAVGLGAAGLGVFFGLRWLLPGGFEGLGMTAQVARNAAGLKELHLRHPVLLVFALPLLLALIGLGRSNRFERACAAFGCALFVPFFLQSNFVEVRAHMPVLILLLPAALQGLRAVLEEGRLAAAA